MKYIEAIKVDKELCLTISMEECSELIQAISKAKRGKLNKENLIEEISDVLICMDWLKEMYKINESELDNMILFKKKRIENRLINKTFK